MTSKNWTNKYIEALSKYKPKNLGVVGPTHHGGNEKILTYDFVHQTHIDIFGFYYPRQFPDWYADGWITTSYKNVGRELKLADVIIRHTMNMGMRYIPQKGIIEKQHDIVNRSTLILQNWMDYYEVDQVNIRPMKNLHISDDEVTSLNVTNITEHQLQIVSFTLFLNNADHTRGALRNLRLSKLLLPEWTIRFYISTNITQNIIQLLSLYGAEVILVDETKFPIPCQYWAYLVADDPAVSRYLVRNATHRLSPRQVHLIHDWLMSDKPFHSLRERPWHRGLAIVPELFGAVRVELIKSINTTMYNLIRESIRYGNVANISDFLNQIIWPKIKRDVLHHDRISNCIRTDCIFNIMPIGEIIDQHEMVVTNELESISHPNDINTR